MAVCIIIAACVGKESAPIALPSVTPQPSSTVTVTPTKTPRPTSTPIPTNTPFPAYNIKQVIFEYGVFGGHSVYEAFFEDYDPDIWIALYDDGQMIISGAIYKQKLLSPHEIKQFFSNLETMGFYSLESNQAHNPTDKLYDFGNNYVKVYDAYSYCIIASAEKSRQLCVYEPGIPYLIPRMNKIFNYLNYYEPVGSTTYYPDRLLVWIQSGRNPYDDKLPMDVIPWDKKFPSLEIPSSNTFNEKIIYVNGNAAKEIYLKFDDTNEGKVFIQNGKEYTVYIKIVLPHEKITNANQ